MSCYNWPEDVWCCMTCTTHGVVLRVSDTGTGMAVSVCDIWQELKKLRELV